MNMYTFIRIKNFPLQYIEEDESLPSKIKDQLDIRNGRTLQLDSGNRSFDGAKSSTVSFFDEMLNANEKKNADMRDILEQDSHAIDTITNQPESTTVAFDPLIQTVNVPSSIEVRQERTLKTQTDHLINDVIPTTTLASDKPVATTVIANKVNERQSLIPKTKSDKSVEETIIKIDEPLQIVQNQNESNAPENLTESIMNESSTNAILNETSTKEVPRLKRKSPQYVGYSWYLEG